MFKKRHLELWRKGKLLNNDSNDKIDLNEDLKMETEEQPKDCTNIFNTAIHKTVSPQTFKQTMVSKVFINI